MFDERLAMSREEALDEIKRCTGTQFDPVVVSAFLKTAKAERIPAKA
jgi:HD-GYP domain-containing protein (c-di-GMP phosphodiesterase class II)